MSGAPEQKKLFNIISRFWSRTKNKNSFEPYSHLFPLTFLIEFVEKSLHIINQKRAFRAHIYFDGKARWGQTMPTDNKLSFSITIYIAFLRNSSFITCNWSLAFRFFSFFLSLLSLRTLYGTAQICYSSFFRYNVWKIAEKEKKIKRRYAKCILHARHAIRYFWHFGIDVRISC